MSRKLYVGGLPYSVDSSQLEQIFAPHGAVNSAQVIMDRDSGRSKGFGFVEMNDNADGQTAIDALNGSEHGGRTLTVNDAKPQERRSGGSFGGGRRERW